MLAGRLAAGSSDGLEVAVRRLREVMGLQRFQQDSRIVPKWSQEVRCQGTGLNQDTLQWRVRVKVMSVKQGGACPLRLFLVKVPGVAVSSAISKQ
jgi:hypothetical protein